MTVASDQILYLRSLLNMTQEQFANQLSYSRSYLRDIENGKVKPSRRFLEALSSKFGVSSESFLSDLGGRVASSLNGIHNFPEPKYVYIYAFTDRDVEKAEHALRLILEKHESLFLDGREIKSNVHLLSQLTGEKGVGYKLYEKFQEICFEKRRTIVIKNYSESSIKGDGKYLTLIELTKIIHGSLHDLIIIDKPSFLEKNYEYLGHYACRLAFN